MVNHKTSFRFADLPEEIASVLYENESGERLLLINESLRASDNLEQKIKPPEADIMRIATR